LHELLSVLDGQTRETPLTGLAVIAYLSMAVRGARFESSAELGSSQSALAYDRWDSEGVKPSDADVFLLAGIPGTQYWTPSPSRRGAVQRPFSGRILRPQGYMSKRWEWTADSLRCAVRGQRLTACAVGGGAADRNQQSTVWNLHWPWWPV